MHWVGKLVGVDEVVIGELVGVDVVVIGELGESSPSIHRDSFNPCKKITKGVLYLSRG